MDFLGLKTLTIIKNALALIKLNHGIEINIDEIPLDDKKHLNYISTVLQSAHSSLKVPVCRNT